MNIVKWIAAFAVGGLAFAAPAEEFALVKDGKAVAEFEFGTMPDAKAAIVATNDIALFNKHLKEVTGAELVLRRGGDTAPYRGRRYAVAYDAEALP